MVNISVNYIFFVHGNSVGFMEFLTIRLLLAIRVPACISGQTKPAYVVVQFLKEIFAFGQTICDHYVFMWFN